MCSPHVCKCSCFHLMNYCLCVLYVLALQHTGDLSHYRTAEIGSSCLSTLDCISGTKSTGRKGVTETIKICKSIKMLNNKLYHHTSYLVGECGGYICEKNAITDGQLTAILKRNCSVCLVK